MAGTGKMLKMQLMIEKSSLRLEVNGTPAPNENNDDSRIKKEVFYKVNQR